MSTYTSQEEKVILKDNDEITYINLIDNLNLKVLIVDNLSKLERIIIHVNDGLYVSISNCGKLIDIMSSDSQLDDDQSGSYFYLGENLKSLESIDLNHFKIVKISNEIFDTIESVHFDSIENLICDFKNFPKLKNIRMLYVTSSDIVIDMDIIKFLLLSFCSFDNIKIIRKGHINNFDINNTEYKSLKIENPIKSTHLSLYNDDNKMIPYIPLSDEIDKILKLYINMDNLYDSEYKFFIERNLSKINLINDENYEELSLDDIKFSIPQKKRAR